MVISLLLKASASWDRIISQSLLTDVHVEDIAISVPIENPCSSAFCNPRMESVKKSIFNILKC